MYVECNCSVIIQHLHVLKLRSWSCHVPVGAVFQFWSRTGSSLGAAWGCSHPVQWDNPGGWWPPTQSHAVHFETVRRAVPSQCPVALWKTWWHSGGDNFSTALVNSSRCQHCCTQGGGLFNPFPPQNHTKTVNCGIEVKLYKVNKALILHSKMVYDLIWSLAAVNRKTTAAVCLVAVQVRKPAYTGYCLKFVQGILFMTWAHTSACLHLPPLHFAVCFFSEQKLDVDHSNNIFSNLI